MDEKRVSESAVATSQVMMPQDANPSGNVHGGVIMKLIDTAGGVVARRHTRCNIVTASIDRLDFHHPVYIGDLLTLKASINLVGRTSIEIGVRAEAEDLLTGQIHHTASAYLTFVALGTDGRPIEVPGLIFETEEEIRRNREACDRRDLRLTEKRREKAHQGKYLTG
ncbi:MAG: acyl-CoA thioesterase [Desulfobacteraceae bacterium]|nr:acyl-CoA thioesterase [Desulfobacteraceae bacterium]